MKRIYLTLLFSIGTLGTAFAQAGYFLIPDFYFMTKGDAINAHLLYGNKIGSAEEQKYNPAENMKFVVYDGSKPTDVALQAKQNGPSNLGYKIQGSGLVMLEAIQKYNDDVTRKKFADYLNDAGLDKMADALKPFQQSFRKRATSSLKTIVMVDKNSGNIYEKPLKEDFEIILQQNPYKLNYGDDVTAVLLFKGKPLSSARIDLTVRTEAGSEFSQILSTNEKGEAFVKASREGIYLLNAIHVEPSADNTADYDTWQAGLSFAFSSTNTMPSSYKQFGLGNKH